MGLTSKEREDLKKRDGMRAILFGKGKGRRGQNGGEGREGEVKRFAGPMSNCFQQASPPVINLVEIIVMG